MAVRIGFVALPSLSSGKYVKTWEFGLGLLIKWISFVRPPN